MKDSLQKAFDTYVALIKQVIALCTAVLGFTIALLKLIPSDQLEIWNATYVALVALILSIFFGILALGRVISFLSTEPTSTTDDVLRALGILQQVCFIAGIIFLVIWLVSTAGT